QPPALAQIVVKEGGIDFQRVRAELAHLFGQLLDGDLGIGRVYSGVELEPLSVLAGKAACSARFPEKAPHETPPWPGVQDRKVNRAFDKFGDRHRIEAEVRKELLRTQHVRAVGLIE